MLKSELERRLVEEFNFTELAAFIYSKCRFRCQYCGSDGLASVDAYMLLEVDHILPKSKYPELKDDLNNQISACSVCNTFKGKFDPSCKERRFDLSDEKDRNELIERSREYIFKKRNEETDMLSRRKELIRNFFTVL